MKSLEINTNSWHYKLATLVGYRSWGQGSDICTYTRKVMLGILLILLITAAYTLATFILVDIVLGLIFSAIAGMWLMGQLGSVVLLSCAMVGTFIGMFVGMGYSIERYNEYNRTARPDGFIKEAYKSWKDKYCLKLTFIDENKS